MAFEDAEAFYRVRDDRTNRCLASCRYQGISCLVTVDRPELASPAGKLMLTVATNLLSRWCRDVAIVLPTGAGALGEDLLAQMRAADPFGRFAVVDSPRASDIHLHVGHGAPEPAVSIFASGWMAAVSRGVPLTLEPDRPPTVGVGAIAAACLGVGEVFKNALGLPDTRFVNGTFDMLRLKRVETNLRPSATPVQSGRDFGDALLVGAGSVGSAFAYSAHLLGLRGRLTVVDFDTVKVENLNRSPIFGALSVGRNKAEVVAEHLAGGRVTVRPVPTSWNDFIAATGRRAAPADVWIPVANEGDVRRSIQSNLPPLMVEAATSENWGVNFGRHAPGLDDCLSCRFPDVVREEHLRCSIAEVIVAGERVDAALPFLSTFAGLLVAAEILRLQMEPYPCGPNYAAFDLGSALSEVQQWNRTCRDDCANRGPAPALKVFPASRYQL